MPWESQVDAARVPTQGLRQREALLSAVAFPSLGLS